MSKPITAYANDSLAFMSIKKFLKMSAQFMSTCGAEYLITHPTMSEIIDYNFSKNCALTVS
jgi:hypothetical protein